MEPFFEGKRGLHGPPAPAHHKPGPHCRTRRAFLLPREGPTGHRDPGALRGPRHRAPDLPSTAVPLGPAHAPQKERGGAGAKERVKRKSLVYFFFGVSRLFFFFWRKSRVEKEN